MIEIYQSWCKKYMKLANSQSSENTEWDKHEGWRMSKKGPALIAKLLEIKLMETSQLQPFLYGKKKREKGLKIRKEGIKLYLFVDDMIIQNKNHKRPIKHPLE